jgi:hypothetical protein
VLHKTFDRMIGELDLFVIVKKILGGPDSSVGIATDYGLDGPGIESRWGRDFSHTSRPVLRPTQPGISRG